MVGKIKSPCIGVCKYLYTLNSVNVCACGRTEDEITEWASYSDDRKRKVAQYAKVRAAAMSQQQDKE